MPAFKSAELGDWEKVELEKTGLVFDGMLTGYTKQGDGQLTVNAISHGLQAGDLVQIVGNSDYDGEYPILAHDENSFTVQRLWVKGEAVNIRLEALKRRGLVFDGRKDLIEIPLSETLPIKRGFSVETWVKLNDSSNAILFCTVKLSAEDGSLKGSGELYLLVHDGLFSLYIILFATPGQAAGEIVLQSKKQVALDAWVHVAAVYDGKQLRLFENGVQAADPLDLPAPFAIYTKAVGLAGQPSDTGGYSANLSGQLADVRIWSVARSDKEISDSMHLFLTGRETGLAGNWRLGGLALGKNGSQRVFDFSVNANHGLAHGAPYAGGVELTRKLRDNETLAVQYTNDDLFAVREGATYEETFEFRTDNDLNPEDVEGDGSGVSLFAPALWGRLSRTSQPIPFTHQFFGLGEEIGDGWRRATCRFIIPENVRLLRCFDIQAVQGGWEKLKIRRHTLRLLSDTVTLSRSNETADLRVCRDYSA